MKKDVMLVIGAGQIGMAIARRVGFGKKIILGDKNIDNARTVANIMNDAGYFSGLYCENVGRTIPKVNSILKALGFGGSVPCAFLFLGREEDLITYRGAEKNDIELLIARSIGFAFTDDTDVMKEGAQNAVFSQSL